MSVRLNGFEREIVNSLQMTMSKREAEDAIYDIREALYGDVYQMIGPLLIMNEKGQMTKEYPSSTDIVKAYWSGDYSKFSVDD